MGGPCHCIGYDVAHREAKIPSQPDWNDAVCVSLSIPARWRSKSKDTPELRAIAVLEWTGEEGKPKASRLVPVTVYDGEVLQDGGVYLARPQPLALGGEVEYELQRTASRSASSTSRTPARSRARGWATARGSRCPQPRSKARHRRAGRGSG